MQYWKNTRLSLQLTWNVRDRGGETDPVGVRDRGGETDPVGHNSPRRAEEL